MTVLGWALVQQLYVPLRLSLPKPGAKRGGCFDKLSMGGRG